MLCGANLVIGCSINVNNVMTFPPPYFYGAGFILSTMLTNQRVLLAHVTCLLALLGMGIGMVDHWTTSNPDNAYSKYITLYFMYIVVSYFKLRGNHTI